VTLRRDGEVEAEDMDAEDTADGYHLVADMVEKVHEHVPDAAEDTTPLGEGDGGGTFDLGVCHST